MVAVNDQRNAPSYDTYIKDSISKTGYCHFKFKVVGGPPNGSESINLKHTVIWPDGSKSNADWYWENCYYGDTVGVEWNKGLGYSGRGGKLTVKVYNKDTNEYLGEGSIKIE